MGNGCLKSLNHSIFFIFSILLVHIVAQNNYDGNKRQICYPKFSSDKFWKLNKRFMVGEEFFDKDIRILNKQCHQMKNEIHCFWAENTNDGFVEDGAFLKDYVPKIEPTTSSTTTTTTIETTTQSTIPTMETTTTTTIINTAPTTEPAINPIQCDEPKFAKVKPAVVIFDTGIPQDKAIRAGFIDYDQKNKFLEKHINETIIELVKNATSLFNESKEVSDWIQKNGNWLQNIKKDSFRYVRVELENEEIIMMVIYNCSFGKFIFAPTTKYNNKFKMDEKIYDWSKDFMHIDGCIEKQEDISTFQLEPNQRHYLMKRVGGSIELKVDFDIGLYNYNFLKFDNAKCEAFKYKYGYTFPLRSDNLNESANNRTRIKRMGRLVSPIEMSCKTVERFALGAQFELSRRGYLVRLGLAKKDCEEATRQASDDCIACLVKSELFWERNCNPFVDCQIIQTIYECNNINEKNSKFTIRIPRVDGHQHFKINGTEYTNRDRVRVYRLNNMKQVLVL